MPLFIQDSDLFEVVVHYVEEGRKVTYFDDGEPMPEAVKKATFKFKYPNWSEQQFIMAGSLTVDENGTTMADPYKYMDSKIKTLLREWDLAIPLTPANVDKLDPSLVNYLNKCMDKEMSIGEQPEAGPPIEK